MRSCLRALCLSMLILAAGSAFAQSVAVTDAWVRLLPAKLPEGGYFTLHNKGDRAITLVGASAPGYGKVILHRTVHSNGVDKMIRVKSIVVKPGGTAVFAPGGYHIMLMQPQNHLEVGDKLPVTLIFADGGKLTRKFEVRSATGE